LQFNPVRFLDPIVPGSFMPFGDGPHKCIGFKLAMTKMKIILARMIFEFDLELVEGQSLEVVSTITYGLKDGLMLKLNQRVQ
jgi:cytochrome P450